MKLTTKNINSILNIKDHYQAPSRLMEILFNKEERENVFEQFLKVESDTSFDWFHTYYQEEHAERKSQKQDFTPESVAEIMSKIVGSESTKMGNSRMDIAAGTGGLTISKWNQDVRENKHCKPSLFLYHCEELSDRAVPFLLFNLMIRGMNGLVVHGDSLERNAKQIYFIQNFEDDWNKFSSLNVMPHNFIVEKFFNINKWSEEEIKHIEDQVMPIHLENK